MNVDVEDLIARVRETIREEYVALAQKKRDDADLAGMQKFYSGFESAADRIHEDLSRIVHYAVVEQQKARGE